MSGTARKPSAFGPHEDPDLDEDGNVDVEHFPIPDALLRAAGIRSDEDWDSITPVPLGGKRRFDRGNFDESDHPRAGDGKFAPSGGGGGGGGSGGGKKASEKKPAAPKKAKEPRAAEPDDDDDDDDAPEEKPTTWAPIKTEPVARTIAPDGKAVAAASPGTQLPPDVQERLKSLGVTKLPAAHIAEVHVAERLGTNGDALHDGALLKWKDDKGKVQSAYTPEFDRRNAEIKWARVMDNRPRVAAALAELHEKAQSSPAHAAVAIIADTALRPGSPQSVAKHNHYGVTTMEARHVTFSDDGGAAHIEYVGKEGVTNRATVTEPALVAALKKNVENKAPTDRVFVAPRKAIATAAPEGVKLKDFRTTAATNMAEGLLGGMTPELTGNPKKDARHVLGSIKAVSKEVAKKLNNTPDMARRSYIAPQIIKAWAEKHNVNPEWIGMSRTGATRANGEHMDPSMMKALGFADGATPNDDEKKQAMAKYAADCAAKMADATDADLVKMADDLEKFAADLAEDDEDGKKMRRYALRMRSMMAPPAPGDTGVAMDVVPKSDPSWEAQNAAIHIKTGNVNDEGGRKKASADSSSAVVMAAVNAANAAMAKRIAELEAKEQERQKQSVAAAEQRFSALVDEAIAAGYPKESRGDLLAMARLNFEAAERLVKPFLAAKGHLFTREYAPSGATRPATADVQVTHVPQVGRVVRFGLGLSAKAKEIARTRKLSYEQALDAARTEHPELVNQMYQSAEAF